jgi:hypothetical protein
MVVQIGDTKKLREAVVSRTGSNGPDSYVTNLGAAEGNMSACPN